jgi:hypothetical protein
MYMYVYVHGFQMGYFALSLLGSMFIIQCYIVTMVILQFTIIMGCDFYVLTQKRQTYEHGIRLFIDIPFFHLIVR